jgi:hypothetical protein
MENDDVSALTYRELSLTVINEMCIRYEAERLKRKLANLEAYEKTSNSNLELENEAANSNQVESLLLGDSLIGQFYDETMNESNAFSNNSASDDFIIFPDGRSFNYKENSVIPPKRSVVLGWNNYKGALCKVS